MSYGDTGARKRPLQRQIWPITIWPEIGRNCIKKAVCCGYILSMYRDTGKEMCHYKPFYARYGVWTKE